MPILNRVNKLKPRIKNGTEVTLKLSSNVVRGSNDENNFSHKFLLINTQVSKLHKTFANVYQLIYVKLSKTHLHKIEQDFQVDF